jgi:hypothetical protein
MEKIQRQWAREFTRALVAAVVVDLVKFGVLLLVARLLVVVR